MERHIPFDKEHADQYLGAAIIAYHEALRAAIAALAAEKGTDDLSWFDQLRKDAVRAAKGTVVEQHSIELDADVVRFGFELLDGEFEAIRVGLVEKKD